MVYHVQFPGLGLDLTVNRVALAIGGFNIYWYGVIIAAGMLLAMLYAFRNAVDYGIDSDRLVDVVAIGAVMSIVCARIYYVAMAPFEYQSLWEMVDIRKGGIAIYGAVIGAFIIGICESFIKANENIAVFSNAFTFALLIIILLCKPNGLFGEKLTEKV